MSFLSTTLGRLIFTIGIALFSITASAVNQGSVAVDRVNNEISIYMDQEPPTLNSLISTDQVSFRILDHITEGLMKYDRDGNLVGGVAESWELTDQYATFKLRKNAKWSDGQPVTANDFVFAWRKILEPEIAAEYAFIMYSVKNGEAINKGELPTSELGVEAIDDYTLRVELKQPTAYFLDLVAFSAFRPVREDFYNKYGGGYAADADKMLFNGPFKLVSWVHGASLRMEKNDLYWDKDAIKLSAINAPYFTSDTNTLLNLFKDDKIIYSNLSSEALKNALKDHLPIQKFVTGSMYYIGFNHRDGRVTANKNLRKALAYAFDAEQFTYKVVAVPGNKPAYTLFPSWIKGKEKTFREEFPPKAIKPSQEKAQYHLKLAMEELGLTEPPTLVYLTGDTPASSKYAEYLQSSFKRILGIDLRIDKQIFKQRLAKMTAGDYDLVGAGWGPDYNDAMTFADLMASWNANNRGRYNNPEYDRLVRLAQSTTDPDVRLQAFADMQDILIEDVTILMQFEQGMSYVLSPEVKGVVRRIFGGDPDFRYAEILPEAK